MVEGRTNWDWCHPWSVSSVFYKIHAEQRHESKPVISHFLSMTSKAPASRFLPCLTSCPDLLQWLLQCLGLRQLNLFLSKYFWWMVFHHNDSNLKREPFTLLLTITFLTISLVLMYAIQVAKFVCGVAAIYLWGKNHAT